MSAATTAAQLGAKLDALDLTADERALLTDLLTPDDAEMTGYNAMLSGMTLSTTMTRPTSLSIIANMGESGSM